jgi:putative membrane protein
MLLVLTWILNALTLFIVAWILPNFHIHNFYSALITALVLGFVNTFIRPVLLLLTLPLNLLTLGLFTFVINAFMLLLVASIVKGLEIEGFGTALSAAILLWLMSFFTNAILSLIANRRSRL